MFRNIPRASLFLASLLLAFSLVGAALFHISEASAQTRAPLTCDINGDGKVSMPDLLLIRAALNTSALPPGSDPRDANADGIINVADMRFCQLRCTFAGCAES